jgi:hypothetical protein
MNMEDPDSCTNPDVCGATGLCGRADGQSCTAGVTACASGFCVAGLCCNRACSSACEVCAMTLGASADGTCTTAPLGYPGSPVCGAVACNGGLATCPTSNSCVADIQCGPGFHCAQDKTCQPQAAGQALGQPCGAPEHCISGFCADGTCCESACVGPCESCANAMGKCTPAAVGTNPRGRCAGAAPCATGCQADGTCGIAAAGVHCDVCRSCDGAGQCNRPSPTGDDDACGRIACGALSTECVDYDDVTSNRCVAVGLCAPPHDATTCTRQTRKADGTPCSAGACKNGQCVPLDGGDTPGGCSLAPHATGGGSWLVVVFALLALFY